MFTLHIDTYNDAFQDDPTCELKRLLGEIINQLDEGLLKAPIRDVNGNTVGEFCYLPEACGADFDVAAHDANGELIVMLKRIAAPMLAGAYLALGQLYPDTTLDHRVHEPEEG